LTRLSREEGPLVDLEDPSLLPRKGVVGDKDKKDVASFKLWAGMTTNIEFHGLYREHGEA
jgi:hypothetical protein